MHNHVNGKPLPELFKETKAITEHLKSLGYEFIEKWECEWRQEQAESPDIRQFLKQSLSLRGEVLHARRVHPPTH